MNVRNSRSKALKVPLIRIMIEANSIQPAGSSAADEIACWPCIEADCPPDTDCPLKDEDIW